MSKTSKLILNKKRNGISEIITLVLIILVATIIIGFVLSWSKSGVKEKLDVSKESLKPASQAECINNSLVIDEIIINVSYKTITIITSNNSNLKFFDLALTTEAENEFGEPSKAVGNFNKIINPGDVSNLNTTQDFTLVKNNYDDLNFETISSLILSNGTCPSQSIDLMGYSIIYITGNTPTATPPAGTYSTSQSITLSAEVGSTIHYTIDGTTPTSSSSVYLVPLVIPLDTNRTIKAIAIRPGYTDSDVLTASYMVTHQLQTPEPSIEPGMYSPEQSITLSGEAGSTYYYTFDGNTPTTDSNLYSGSITLTYGYTTLKVLAVKEDYGDSEIYSGNYFVYRVGRYWVGGSGNWSDTNHWSTSPGGGSGASVPSASDDVYFDANSFSVNGAIVTLDVNANCLSMNWSEITKTATFSNSLYTLNVYGDLILDSNLTWATGYDAAKLNINTTTSMTFDTKGIQMSFGANGGGLFFNGSGTYNLSNNIIGSGNPAITVNSGTLNTNSYNLYFNQMRFSGTSIINLGASTLTTIIYDCATNVTLNAGTSTLKNKTNGAIYGFGGGNKNYYDIEYYGQTTGYILDVASCNNFTFIPNGTSLNLNLGSNLIVNGTFTINGSNSTTNRALFKSTAVGTVRKITAANVVASNVDFRDINLANPIDLSSITGGSGDGGGNYGITFTTAVPQYFKHTSGAVSWSDSTKWFSDYNRTVLGRVPLPQDDVTFDANSFSGTSTLTVDVPRIGKSLDMNAVDDNVTMSLSNDIETYGNFILGNNITPSGSKTIYLCGRSNYNFNTYGKTIYSFYSYAYGGTYTNQSNIVCTGGVIFYIYNGTFDFNDYNLSAGGLYRSSSGSTIYLGNGTFTTTNTGTNQIIGLGGTIYVEGSTFVLNPTPTTNTLTINSGIVNFNNLWLSGTHTGYFDISGSTTINNLRIDPGRKVRFTAGTTTTITNDFNVTGTDTNFITLGSITPGSYWKISKSSGVVSSDYLNISDSNATGGATFYAGAYSIDGNHNIGWNFTSPPGRYWVGGSGNWSDTNHWSSYSGGPGGSSVPTSSDDVYFNVHSFSVDSSTVTVDVNAYTKSIDFTNIDQTATLSSTVNNLSVYGSIALSSKLTWSFTSTAYTYFKATTSVTMKMNGSVPSFNILYMDGVGGKWTLLDDMNCGRINPWTFVNGEFDTNSKNITKTAIGDLSWQVNAGTKKLTLGSSIITLGNGVLFGTSNDAGLTVDAGTSTIKQRGDWFTGATKTYYNVEINKTSTTINGTIGAFTCTNLSRTSGANILGNMPISTDINVTGTLTLTGYNSTNYRLLMASNTIGTVRKITAANVVASNVDFRDINFANSINLSSITGGSGDGGGNYGITFTTAVPQYFKHTTGAVSWSNSSKWFSDYNRTIAGRVPLPQDDVTFDQNSFSGTSTLTIDVPRIGRSLDMSAVDDNVTFSISNSIESYGSFILGTNVSVYTANYRDLTLLGRSNYYLSTNHNSNNSIRYLITSVGGSYTLLSNLYFFENFNLGAGTLDLNDYNVDGSYVGYFVTGSNTTLYLGNGILTIRRNYTASAGLTISSSSTIYSEGSTIKLELSSSNGAYNGFFFGGGKTYNNLWISGTHTGYNTISGSNTFNRINIDPGRKASFEAGKTTTITGDLNATGTDINRITLASITPGSYWKISKSSGIISNDYLDISDSNATGGATFYAGANSIDTNHNTGWIFTAPPGRYWVGGSGTWDTNTSNWSTYPGGPGGASVPTSSDDCYFDGASGNVTITTSGTTTNYCKDLIFTSTSGNFIGTFNHVASTVVRISGSLTMNSVMTYSLGSATTSEFVFNSTTTGKTITTASKTFGNITFNGVGGAWTLLDSLTTNSSSTITLTQGTLVTGAFTHNWGIFNSSNSNTRTLNMTNSTINLITTSSCTIWDLVTVTNFTLIDNSSSVINITANTGDVTFVGGFKTYSGTLQYSGTGSLTLSRANTFNNLIFDGSSKTSTNMKLILGSGADQNITGSLVLKGGSNKYRLFVNSGYFGISRLITLGSGATSSFENVDFRDINGAGTFNWDLSSITGGSGNAGGNNGILFTTAQDNYWVADTGSWSDSNKWKLSDHTSAGRVPLPQDRAIFDANSFTTTSRVVTADVARAGKDINFSGITVGRNPSLSQTVDLTVYGSFILKPSMTVSYPSVLYGLSLEGRSSHILSLQGIQTTYNLNINSIGGTYTLDSNINIPGNNFYVNYGTFDASTYGVTVYGFNSNNSNLRSIRMGSGIWNITASTWNIGTTTNLTFDSGTSTIVFNHTSYSVNFSGGGLTYYDFKFLNNNTAGVLTFSNPGSFNNFICNYKRTITMQAGSTTTIRGDFNVSGIDDNNKVTFVSSIPGSYWNIVKASGLVSVDYLNLSDSNASGGALWYAGTHSTDTNHNAGWTFGVPVGRYWVGGSGEWSLTNTTNWSTYPGGPGGASVPTLSNDVYFDANSGSGTVTVKEGMNAKSLICTGYTGALYGEAVATSLNLYGNLTLSSTMSFTQGVGFVIYFKGNASGRTITTAGQTPSYFIFHMTGGDITLQDNLTLNQYWRFYDLGGGTVNTNSKTISVTNQTFDFSTSYTATGTFNFSNSIINLSVTTIGFSPTMNFVSTGSRINLIRSTNTFNGGGKSFNIVSDGGVGGAITFSDANTTIATLDVNKATTLTFNSATNIGNFNYKGAASNNSVVLGANINVTGDLNIQGNSERYRTLVTSNTLGTPRTITNNGTSSVKYLDFRDINGAGTFNWDLSSITGGSGNALGNSGILFTTSQDNYWVADTGSWSDSNKWKLSDHTSSGRVPLPQDNVFFDVNSFTTTSRVITADVARLGKDINFTGITNSPTLSISQAYTIYGSLTLSSLLTYTYNSYSPSFEGRGTHTITSAGKEIGYGFYIRSYGGNYTLMDNAITNSLFRVENGIFNANDYNFTAYAFISNAGTTINMGSGIWKTTGNSSSYNLWYNLGDINSGSSTLELSGNATSAYVRTFNTVSGTVFNNINISGKSTSLAEFDLANNFTVNGILTITAPNKIKVSGGKTITMGPSSSIVLTNNNDTNKIDLNVISGTTKWNITRPSGTQVFSLDYLNLDYSNAVDANTFYAGTHSVDGNNNTGWVFTAPPSGQLSTPVADPVAGTYLSSQNVSLSSDVGATIHYTLDGTTPTVDSNVYSTPIAIPQDATTVLKAIAIKNGSTDSNVFSGTYVIYTMSALFTLNAGQNGKYTGTYSTASGFPSSITITKYSLDSYDNNITIDNNIVISQEETKDLNLGIINSSPTIKLYLSDGNIITKTTTNTNTAPEVGDCPTGYVPVPGNVIYGTESGSYSSKKGFCVAKYEMKVDENNDGLGDMNATCKDATYNVWKNYTYCSVDNVNRKLVSSAEGYPFGSILLSAAVSACSGLGSNYHMINNNEFMTLARNIEIVTSNWASGTIGSGALKMGNVGASYAGSGYNGDNPDYGSSRNELAKYTLTNGSEVWDLSGNCNEMINKTIYRKDQPDAVYDINGVDFNGWTSTYAGYSAGESTNPQVHIINDGNSSVLGYNQLRLLTSSSYSAVNNNIGKIYTYSDIYDTSTTNYILIRGGYWSSSSVAGLLSLNLSAGTGIANSNMGFRCVYVPS